MLLVPPAVRLLENSPIGYSKGLTSTSTSMVREPGPGSEMPTEWMR